MSELTHNAVHVNGIRMHYVQAGTGDTLVLLLHGFPEFWFSWRYQLAALSPSFTVVAPDLRGYNDTDKPDWGYTVDVLSSDMAELIRALGFTQAVVVGHDWGGGLAWHLAITAPELVQRLVVLNMPHPARFIQGTLTNPLQLARSSYIGFFQLPFVAELVIGANNFALLDQMFLNAAYNKAAFSAEVLQTYRTALAKPGALTAALNWYRQLGSSLPMFTTQDAAALRVAVPAMLIWGEQDPILGRELSYGTERYAPQLRTHYIRESGHWVQQEQPELVTRYLLDFLRDLSHETHEPSQQPSAG